MKRIILALICGIAMMAPSIASAQGGSTCQSYNPQLCNKVSNQTAQRTTAAQTSAASTLPFTGMDLVALIAGGSVLLGAGLVVRQLSRDPS